MTSRTPSSERWRIVSLDPELDLSIVSDFRPEGGVEDLQPGVFATAGSVGSSAPDTQWIRSGARTKRLRDSFVSRDMSDDLRPIRRKLERLRERDPALLRPPLISLTWGDQELTGLAIDVRITEDGRWTSGLPRRITVEIVVQATQRPSATIGATPTGETTYVTLGAGQVLESLAAQLYGDASRGELIRRQNPELASRLELAGDLVKVLEADHPDARGTVRPLSAPFLSDGWEDLVNELAAQRGTTASPGTSYALLPEIAAGTWPSP
jgi:hypothetical protein